MREQMNISRPSERLQVVIIGSGMIGDVHRRAAILAGGEVAGVMASTPERSDLAAARWRTRAVANLADLARFAPDIVHVCSPNALHLEHVKAALACGAHVICEKPLAIDAASARDVCEAAAARGKIATVPFVYRFHPLIREIRARVQQGEFGKWHLLHGSYLQDWLLSPHATSWRVNSKIGGASRAFADIGSHWCDLVEFVSGEKIAAVMASMTTTIPERPANSAATFGAERPTGETMKVDTEDAAVVTFKTASGVLGVVTISQISAGRKNRLWFELDGAEKSVVFDQENPETIWIGSEGPAMVVNRDPARGAEDQRRLSVLPPGHPQGYAQCFDNFVNDTYAAVKGELHDGLPSFADGLRSAHIVEAVIQSARARQWVDVKS
ncbi:Gfo/Idh/MocA family protein [Acidocella sp.]|uniref:Gfo/Idh/MocA family protein n=1 Tax=Acidocella sp. TaxID=50710 RepID=UPI002607CB52|nr:Gfo/Idh/MocA family oxidoreductase [Acidocella sp.]